LPDVEDQEVIAQELSGLGEKIRGLEKRLVEVERVNARLEDAALITARAVGADSTSGSSWLPPQAARAHTRTDAIASKRHMRLIFFPAPRTHF
jgi:hypothetical protein